MKFKVGDKVKVIAKKHGHWFNARGCRIEHQVAREYGIKILDKDFFTNKQIMSTRN
jgi:hypothetical protein